MTGSTLHRPHPSPRFGVDATEDRHLVQYTRRGRTGGDRRTEDEGGLPRHVARAETVAVLGARRRRQAEERLAAGEAWQDHRLVFVDVPGVAPHPETVTRWWREAVERAGVPPVRLHDAGHTAATLMLRAGVNVKVVSQRLGHADIAVTMHVYQP